MKRVWALTLSALLLLPLLAFGAPPNEQPQEFRGVWVATVVNTDWPSKATANLSIGEQKAELIKILDETKAMGLNAVIFQVRPTADAFYASRLNPWSKYLTGEAGKDPGYDPLAFAVEEAHQRGLELHAWFNPYRVAMDTKRENLPEGSFARQHPETVFEYDGKLYYDPGLPQVQQHIIASILEVVANYDVDGVHLDDYFYPYPGGGGGHYPDQKTYERYAPAGVSREDWRRENVNQLIQFINTTVKAVKPDLQFGISPFGIWRNQSAAVPEGSKTRGMEAYSAIYADARRWAQEGWLDYIAPQLYWSIGFSVADYEELVNWWADVVKDSPTKLYVGHGVYKVGNNTDTNWQKSGEIIKQLKLNQTIAEVEGSIFFSFRSLRANPLGVKDQLKAFYGGK